MARGFSTVKKARGSFIVKKARGSSTVKIARGFFTRRYGHTIPSRAQKRLIFTDFLTFNTLLISYLNNREN